MTDDAKAFELGKQAFHNGLKCVAFLDNAMMELFVENGFDKATVDNLTAHWVKGWTDEAQKTER